MLTLALALAPFIAPPLGPLPPQQQPISIRLRTGGTLPSGETVRAIRKVAPNLGAAGYAVLVNVGPDPNQGLEVWADFVDDGTSSLQRLYGYPTASFTSAFIRSLEVQQGQVVVDLRQSASGGINEDLLYVNGQVALEAGDPSPIPGALWTGLPETKVTSGGVLVHRGHLFTTSPFLQREVIIASNMTTPLLSESDTITGNVKVSSIDAWDVSPNRQHWAASVRTNTNQYWMLVDGLPAQFYGAPMRSGIPFSSAATAALGITAQGCGFSTIAPIALSVSIDDDGDWCAAAQVPCTASTFQDILVQNGRLVEGSLGANAFDATQTGHAVAVYPQADAVQTAFGEVVTPGAAVDVDQDGLADAGWTMMAARLSDENGAARLFASLDLRDPSGAYVTAVGSLPRRLPFETYCDGERNGDGAIGHLFAVGEASAASNELRLVAHGVTLQSSGYALASLTPSAPMQPNGSVGRLCLGGAIGRYVTSVMTSGSLGSSAVTLDLTSMPQPTGSVSASAGQTWHFQVWYRDVAIGVPTSNFTDAISVLLQ